MTASNRTRFAKNCLQTDIIHGSIGKPVSIIQERHVVRRGLQEHWSEIKVPLQKYRAPLSGLSDTTTIPDREIHQGKAMGSSDLIDRTIEFSQVRLMQRILNQNATIIQTGADIWKMIKFKT